MSTEPLAILAHPKPMRRHTKHVVRASCDYTIRLPGADGYANAGLHLVLKFDDGATQRIVFPLGRTLDKLEQGARMAAALQDDQGQSLAMSALAFTNIVERYMRGDDGPADPPSEEEVSTALYALRALINCRK